MSNIIDSIEYHEDVLPTRFSLLDTSTYMAIIFGWAYERQLCSPMVYQNNDLYGQNYELMKNNQISIEQFVLKYLDGTIRKDFFAEHLQEFMEDYIETATLTVDLCYFFKVDYIYAIPKDWQTCNSCFSFIDEHWESVKGNYG